MMYPVFSVSRNRLLFVLFILFSPLIYAAEKNIEGKTLVRVNHQEVSVVRSNYCKISLAVSTGVAGSGAFSLVRNGVCKALDESGRTSKLDVVVKEFTPELTIDKKIVREYQYLNQLSDRSDYFVRPVCQIVNQEHKHCIVMERGGISLSDMLRENKIKVFDDEFVIETGKRLSAILTYIHSEFQLVHRDIKLDNILFENGIYKIIDLGLMVPVGKNVKTGGSPFYVPNESYENGKASGKMDVFSLGVMLYRMKFGAYPQEHLGNRKFEFDMQVMAFQYSKFNQILDRSIAKEDDSFVSILLRMIRPFSDERPDMAEVSQLFDTLLKT